MPTIIISIFVVLLVLLLFTAALVIFRATIFGRVPEAEEPIEVPAVDQALVAEHLGQAIRIETISEMDHSKINTQTFDQLHATFEQLYPRVHATLKREKVNGYGLLYTWKGRSDDLDPIAILGHMDVVPIDPATQAEWKYPPFSGVVAEDFIWGRGALDIKSTVVTALEAVEGLLKAGYYPERTVYLAFGHDEEIGGLDGARKIVALLQERGIQLAGVLDEGGAIMEGLMPGVQAPVALVGITEKGHASYELSVEATPGHSSMPPRHTAIGVLARAINRIEANPMPEHMNMVGMMFAELGAFLPFSLRMALANTWLFNGVIRKQLAASPTTNALIRTSMAVTMIHGGVKDNILPAKATAVVNCRIFPGDTVETVQEHLRKVINDEAVQISYPEDDSWNPSPVSPTTSPIYKTLTSTIRQVFPEAVVAPYLVAGATDSRYYTAVSPNVFRFSPYHLNGDLLKTMHGTNERIPVESAGRMVQFYMQLIKNWTTIINKA